VTEEGQGLDLVSIAIIVTLIEFGGHVGTQFWDDVLWPRIKRKLGDDAVGPPIED
jgi:hypothetical protein